jgi:16S rRNA (guanine527-N7)-methyltransferase
VLGVTEGRLEDRIAERLLAFNLPSDPHVVAGSAEYLMLLRHWNRRINLTALPLPTSIPDVSIDKLIVEPLFATKFDAPADGLWFDIGSGGGSPAIPLRLAWRSGRLCLVDSKAKRGAFLREAIRRLALNDTVVSTARFEDIAKPGEIGLATVRAVRLDGSLLDAIVSSLEPGGRLLCFGKVQAPASLTVDGTAALPDGSQLLAFRRI